MEDEGADTNRHIRHEGVKERLGGACFPDNCGSLWRETNETINSSVSSRYRLGGMLHSSPDGPIKCIEQAGWAELAVIAYFLELTDSGCHRRPEHIACQRIR